MKHVYIAGPFTGKNRWLQELNVQIAEAAAFDVCSLGAVAVCPHTMYRNYDGTQTAEFWYMATESLLARCDVIYMLPAWRGSAGSGTEHTYAATHDIPIFYDLHVLGDWLTR